MSPPPPPRIRATFDPNLSAVLYDLTPLAYTSGGLEQYDVPVHVRAASAVRRSAERLVIVQDDVNVLVLRHGEDTGAILLPAGEGGRRSFETARSNKHAKLDLEACAALPDGRLVAFGSGSTRARERLVVLGDADSVRVFDGPELYALLRADAAFSGSELNVEGALVVDGALRLFQRGNGAPTRGVLPVNATVDLPLLEFVRWLDGGGPVPTLRSVVQYDLGDTDGVPFTFTDAALLPDGRVAFLACAEASPDTYRDGEVLGCRVGISDGTHARLGPILHSDGRPTRLKLEGIESRPNSPGSFDVVADMDRPDEPALSGRLEVRLAPFTDELQEQRIDEGFVDSSGER